MSVSILRAGLRTTIQDLGRVGFREAGVSVGGALDPHALRVANLLVGNEESDAGIESTLAGLRMRFSGERVVAWCGADFDVRIQSTSLPSGRPAFVGAGEELTMNQSILGCRAWLAISGGIDVAQVLKSRATDLRANFGGLDGRALRDGDVVPLGKNPPGGKIGIDSLRKERISSWGAQHDWASPSRSEPVLRVIRGGNWDRFRSDAHASFLGETFSVTADADRMGARLDGPELKGNEDADLVSEAVAPGAVQVPPNGKPIVLLGDCQTIGGYPKIAHVISVDFSVAAQLRPGDRVRFREVSLAGAHRLLFERERDLEQFRIGIKLQAR